MNNKLVPRFYYTLPIHLYGTFFSWKKDFSSEGFLNLENSYWLNSSRVGLRLLLNSIGDKPLNIGVQAYTCHTVFQSIEKAGHTPVFLDLSLDFKLDLKDLKEKVDTIDVLLITHTFGFLDAIEEIKTIAAGKIIIEDCAHSFLSNYNGNFAGSLADASIFSTGLGKFPAVGSGGLCLINENKKFPLFEEEYAKVSKPSGISSLKVFVKTIVFSFMMKPPFYGLITYKLGKKLDKKMDLGNKFTFDEFKGYSWSKKVFKNNISFYHRIKQRQTKNAKSLNDLIKNERIKILRDVNEKNVANNYIFPLLVEKRDKLFDVLLENGIEPGKHFHKSLEWASEYGYKEGDCPNSEVIVRNIIAVPIHFGVSKKSLIKIAKIINEHE